MTANLDNTGSGALTLPSLLVRGLPVSYALSGLRSLRGSQPVDLVFVDRIEVSKGPGGVRGGVADFRGRGGVVNLVLKEAEPVSRQVFSQSLGTQDSGNLRVSAALGAPVGDHVWRLAGYGDMSGRTEDGYARRAGSGLLVATSYYSGAFKAAMSLQSERRRDTPAAAARGGFIERNGRRIRRGACGAGAGRTA